MERLLVTGGGGFLGSHFLAKTALYSRYEVVAAGRGQALCDPRGRHVQVDCGDADQLRSLVKDVRPRLILNLAGSIVPDFGELVRLNVLAVESMLAAARDLPGKTRVVLIGSAAEYGFPPRSPIDEKAALSPVSLYGLTKAMQAELAAYYRRQFPDSLEIVIARLFNLLGSGLSNRLALGSFVEQIVAAEKQGRAAILRVGNLESRRDFLHVDDVVSALESLLEVASPRPDYVVASGKSLRIGDLVDRLIRLSGHPVSIEIAPDRMRGQDVSDIAGNAEALQTDTGWRARRDPTDGLPEMLTDSRTRL